MGNLMPLGQCKTRPLRSLFRLFRNNASRKSCYVPNIYQTKNSSRTILVMPRHRGGSKHPSGGWHKFRRDRIQVQHGQDRSQWSRKGKHEPVCTFEKQNPLRSAPWSAYIDSCHFEWLSFSRRSESHVAGGGGGLRIDRSGRSRRGIGVDGVSERSNPGDRRRFHRPRRHGVPEFGPGRIPKRASLQNRPAAIHSRQQPGSA